MKAGGEGFERISREPREEIASLLAEVRPPGGFTARRAVAADALAIEVEGVGPLSFPISPEQAERLCEVARPARYGRGEETLLDSKVRDCWEIPKSRLKIDRRRWNRALGPALEELRAELGLPEGCRLEAELHNLLVYAPGQFFARHQDSEKADRMVGTLVAVLPSRFRGGALVVEHQGEVVSYRAPRASKTKTEISLVAFYADCYHEVRPVTEGHRITLTYNLSLVGDGAAKAAAADPATVEAVAEPLRRHFETPRPPRWSSDTAPRQPPDRLVFLLDHQYTERGVGWDRLKGNDAARVAVLQAAAERAGCEALLALAEIQESWDAYEQRWNRPWRSEHYRWERDEDDDWYEVGEDDEPLLPAGPDCYDLVDLLDSTITMDRWIEPSGKAAVPIAASVDEDEVCHVTPTSALEPYASEYEGYMGNYGNTMDRWYRRAAVVLWPRERAFAVRAQASAAWAVEELARRLRAGAVAEARDGAASLLPFWSGTASSEERRGFFGKVLRVADGLEDPELAAALLAPFRVEAIALPDASALVALVDRYGEPWLRTLLACWSDEKRAWVSFGRQASEAWIEKLPSLCSALVEAKADAGTRSARLLLEDRWVWWQGEAELAQSFERPSLCARRLPELAEPLLGWLEATALVGAADLREAALSFLCAPESEGLADCLIEALRRADRELEPAVWEALDLGLLRDHSVRLLEARLAVPARAEGDWSLVLPPGCSCELCHTLEAFLSDSDRDRYEWPIAKERRRHVHGRLDAHELPVRHETRRKGSPYTLVLTKKPELFEREAAARRAWQADLEWLSRT